MERIVHARIGEDGHIWGEPGDQTKQEVMISNFYSFPWDFMAIHPDENVRNKHAECSVKAANNDNIGYNQYQRNTLWNLLRKITDRDIAKVGLCNCDCSSLQHALCMISNGMPENSYNEINSFYTGNEEDYLRKYGYVIIKDQNIINNNNYCVKGGIYCKAGRHTVNAIDNGKYYKETLKIAGVEDMEEKTNNNYIGTWETTGSINIRKDAGTNYSVVDTLSKGENVYCEGKYKQNGNTIWLYIKSSSGIIGWCSTVYMKQITKEEYKTGTYKYNIKNKKITIEIDIEV